MAERRVPDAGHRLADDGRRNHDRPRRAGWVIRDLDVGPVVGVGEIAELIGVEQETLLP